MIDVREVVVEYGKKTAAVRAVDKVSLRVAPGESLALVGPSGCGKSSLLFAMAGLIRPVGGTIAVNGDPLVGPRREIALILQNAGLLPWKTVWQNANLSLLLQRDYPRTTAKAVLQELGLGDVKQRYPAELSEGMKRRVGVARALSTSPNVMLMDEPLASLDTITKERIQDLFLKLWKRHAFALVLVTHDIEEAAFLGQRIVVLSERPARVVEIIENPTMGEVTYRDAAAFADTIQRLRAGLERG
jgi:NitT/TauT family transport system ATP-binding protein